MDLLLWGVGLALLAAIAYALLRQAGTKGQADPQLLASLTALSAKQAEISGQMLQFSANAKMEQENLTKALNERLDALGKRVGDSLIETTEKTTNSMTDLQKRLAVIDSAQKNITELSGQVVSLQDILSNKQARGAFGEIQLGDIVRDALPPAAYQLQAQLGNGKRADCLIKLPYPPGPIAIDSKFPLEAYRALREARDDAGRAQAARAFVADVRKHVDDIAARYIVPGETAEMAMMFLPSEAVYAELHANFQPVVEHGNRARVYIVSPSTMMAMLISIRAVLKDVRMREQASVIQKEVLTLFRDVERLQKRTENLRTHFSSAEKDIREIEISTDKIVSRVDKIEQIQLSDGAVAEDLPIGSVTARTLAPD